MVASRRWTTLSVLLLWLAMAMDRTNGARILGLFIHPGPSHFYSFYPVMETLALNGHDVTTLSYFKVNDAPSNYQQLVIDGMPVINSSLDITQTPSRNLFWVYHEFYTLFELADVNCRDAYGSQHIDTILKMHRQQPFDIAMVEMFDTDCALGLVDVLNIPHIGLSSCAMFPWYYDRINLPDWPSYVPSGFLDHSHNMNWMERTKNWFIFKTMKMLFRIIQYNDNRLIRERLGSNVRDVADIANDISLILINQHYSISGPRPLSNQLIEIGGIHIKAAKPLPQRFKAILDNAEHGVVIISWGGNIRASSMAPAIAREILNALARLSQQVIWKWEDDSLDAIAPKNVHIFKWVPQRDILDHSNVKLFWSHGGNLGTYESIHCGVPLMVTPIYGDQFINARAVAERDVGVYLPYTSLVEETIFQAIQYALAPSVHENSNAMAYEFTRRPQTAKETAVWWVEHVIATRGAPLVQLKTYEMSSFVYYSLDAILVVAATFASILFAVVFCCRYKQYRKTKTKSS